VTATAAEAEVTAAPPLVAGEAVSFGFVVTAEEMESFAALSGDRNPLHADTDYARTRGFAGPVVYGGLLTAKVSRLVGMELPTRDCVWTHLDIDFRNPLYVGEPATLAAEILDVSEAVHAARLRFRIATGDRLVARGTAELVYGDGAPAPAAR
jgi:3-hydroxybutyryl-CoA dehydratase